MRSHLKGNRVDEFVHYKRKDRADFALPASLCFRFGYNSVYSLSQKERITRMNMKDHILAALSEQLADWETSLAGLSEEQLTRPAFDKDWSILDVMNHLWGWQQITLARMEAARLGSEPTLPSWLTSYEGDWAAEDADAFNAWMHNHFHQRTWAETHQQWRLGFLQLLESSRSVPEPTLLDGDRYVWLNGYPLSAILVSTYDHHAEHMDTLRDWLKEQEK
jgi:hypothetical protein